MDLRAGKSLYVEVLLGLISDEDKLQGVQNRTSVKKRQQYRWTKINCKWILHFGIHFRNSFFRQGSEIKI
jgi:hypothetical protein